MRTATLRQVKGNIQKDRLQQRRNFEPFLKGAFDRLAGSSLCGPANQRLSRISVIGGGRTWCHERQGIDLNVSKGEVLSIIGASSSRKYTLLYCIYGLEPIQAGSVKVHGTGVHAKYANINELRQNLGMVFQQWNSFPHLMALKNVALAFQIAKGKSKANAREIATKRLEHIGLGDKLGADPSAPSGGQQQRLDIARALTLEPAYMLFNEVTSALIPS